jgi:hypothetical protein
MEAARTSETSVDNHFTRQYNPEDSSEHHTRRRENLKSHDFSYVYMNLALPQDSYSLWGSTRDLWTCGMEGDEKVFNNDQ